ncbi:TNT domain-containing protein [Kitasatospora sp. NPDC096147]|uniref:TNT domain-containing protein n=1 Tax=Kitasatospora sp. NPDC096147 TaxID=3364093 RepID=UPI00382D987B
MRIRQALLAIGMTATLLTGTALVNTAAATTTAATATAARAATPSSECSAQDFHGDKRLGPEQLPTTGPVGRQLWGYQRTGGLGEQQFLDTYYDTATGSWRYPPADGYVTLPDGTPLEIQQTLVPGQRIDRYGSEYGSYLAPEGLPYATRALPPQSLDSDPAPACNYHVYKVAKAFTVDAGPIAPWFGQPGHGWQFQLDARHLPGAPARLNVLWLIDNGYLART